MRLKKAWLSAGIAMVLVAVSVLVSPPPSADGEQRMIGLLTKISTASDGKSADVTLKDIKTGKEIVLYVTNELVLDKFRYGKTVTGDQIRAKYEVKNGKNHSTYFKKVSGE